MTPILFFGVGPTLHHVFLAAGEASEIHLGDYLPANLREIERWIERDDEPTTGARSSATRCECEGVAAPPTDEITQREDLTRAKITRLLEVDLRASPIPWRTGGPYGTVISAYCADSATATGHLGDLHEAHRRPGASRRHAS